MTPGPGAMRRGEAPYAPECMDIVMFRSGRRLHGAVPSHSGSTGNARNHSSITPGVVQAWLGQADEPERTSSVMTTDISERGLERLICRGACW